MGTRDRNFAQGYSAPWEDVFNAYLHLPHTDYVEVCWDTVFTTPLGAPRRAGGDDRTMLTPQEQVVEERIREDLLAALAARTAPSVPSTSALPRCSTRVADGMALGEGSVVTEWSELQGQQPNRRGILPPWLSQPDTYLGDFTKYLASRRVRTAVKEKFKEQLRPLMGGAYAISIIAHSWGTVVAYESLLDLELEAPALTVANLFTLGSPLWLVRHLLDDQSGRKPKEAGLWVNIHARGDPVGSWLSPNFRVDRDFEVPSVGDDAHGSYFVSGNAAVQNDLIGRAILTIDMLGVAMHRRGAVRRAVARTTTRGSNRPAR